MDATSAPRLSPFRVVVALDNENSVTNGSDPGFSALAERREDPGRTNTENSGNRVEMYSSGSRRGFTIIELVIVLSVSSILAAIAILQVAPSLERARLRRSAAMIATDLQWAQMIAARQRRPVVFIASEALRGYMIRDAAGSTVFREAYLGDDTEFHLDQLEANPTALEIFPNGVVRSTGSYTIRVNDVRRNVRISRAGQVRITSVP